MQQLLERFLQIPSEIIHSVGYSVLFILEVLESIPPFGMLTPGQTLVVVAGMLARMEVFSVIIVRLIIFTGGQLGDTIAYFIGKKYGLNFLNTYGKYFKISEEILEKVKHILQKNLVRGILLSKFYGWTRGILQFIAGSMKTDQKKVISLSCLSNFLRSTTRVLIGYGIGASYEMIADKIGKIMTIGIGAIGISIIAFFIIKHYQHTIKKSFFFLVGTNILTILAFSLLAQKVYSNKLFLIQIDQRVAKEFLTHPLREQRGGIIDQRIDFRSVGLIGLFIIIFLYRKKHFYQLTVFVSTMISGMMIFPLIKLLIPKTPKLEMLRIFAEYSFPSGQMTIACLLAGLIRSLFHPYLTTKRKKICLLSAGIGIIILIGATRMRLHEYWFTDVAGGLLLAISILTSNMILRTYLFKKHLEHRKLIVHHSRKKLIDILTEKQEKKHQLQK